MSKFTFRLPDLGEGTVQSEIGEWLVKVDDDVAEGDVLATIMTDKDILTRIWKDTIDRRETR